MGYKIDFLLTPVQFTIPITINFSAQESANVNARISKLLEKGIVVKSECTEKSSKIGKSWPQLKT